jgi:hypothetical protein
LSWRRNPEFKPEKKMTELEKLQASALQLSHHTDALRQELMLLEAEVSAARDAHMLTIRSLTRSVIKRQSELAEGIQAHPELFDKPRTLIVDGIKFGLRKQPGRMSWGDDEQLRSRMDDLFAKGEINTAQYDTVVETRHVIVSKGLEKLDAKTLKRLGVTVEADSDAVEIKSVDSDVQKMVKAVIKDAVKDAVNDAALAQPQERA